MPEQKLFAVYRQLHPRGDHREWIANFQLAGTVQAYSGSQALDKARELGITAPVVCAA